MKIESMRTRSYRSFKVDDADLPVEARERTLALRRFDELRTTGCAEQAAPKSTRPRRVRRWSYKPSDVKAVMDLRRQHPFMGKAPIQRLGAALDLRPTATPSRTLRDLGDLAVAREGLVRDRVAALNRQKGQPAASACSQSRHGPGLLLPAPA